ncbi:phage virion morphogenesis protein, partial [Xanthomonas campestris pv. incanae]
PNAVSVGFVGRVARIARVHHNGLPDAVRPNGPRVRYQRRILLGLSEANRADIQNLLMDHLKD